MSGDSRPSVSKPKTYYIPGHFVERSFEDFDDLASDAYKWDLELLKLDNGKALGKVTGCHTANMQVALNDWGSRVLRRAVGPSGSITFRANLSGELPVVRGRRLDKHSIWVLPPKTEDEVYSSASTKVLMISIALEEYERRMHAMLGEDPVAMRPSELFFRCDRAKLPGLLQSWQRLIELGRSQPHHFANPHSGSALEAEMISSLAATIVTPYRLAPPWIRHRAARRARDMIEAHAKEPVSIPDICETIGANQRTLELGFHDLFGISPKQYITKFRLDRARSDLRHADPSRTSVTEVATKWGFFHFGRFAGEYRERFGETPHMTLLKRAGRDRHLTTGGLEPDRGWANRAILSGT